MMATFEKRDFIVQCVIVNSLISMSMQTYHLNFSNCLRCVNVYFSERD